MGKTEAARPAAGAQEHLLPAYLRNGAADSWPRGSPTTSHGLAGKEYQRKTSVWAMSILALQGDMTADSLVGGAGRHEVNQ